MWRVDVALWNAAARGSGCIACRWNQSQFGHLSAIGPEARAVLLAARRVAAPRQRVGKRASKVPPTPSNENVVVDAYHKAHLRVED